MKNKKTDKTKRQKDKQKDMLKKREKDNMAGAVIFGMTILFVLSWGFDIRMPQREIARDEWLEEKHEAYAGEIASGESIEVKWWDAWNDIQGPPIEEKYLWSINTHWDALNSSDCNPLWMAAIWHNETGNDVTSNNPFQLKHPSSNETMDGFAEDVRRACDVLKSKTSYDIPRDINAENIGIYATATYGYNGLAYGPNWPDSPYVTNNLDSQHVDMMHCAIDGCAYKVKKQRDGVMTFFLKLLKQGE